MEKAFLPQELSEVRAIQSDEGVWSISGRAIVFNRRSRPMRSVKSLSLKINSFCEIIDPRALDGANLEDAISCWNHNTGHILGSVRNMTATYEITPEGMDYTTFPLDTATNRDLVLGPISRRDVTGSSFVFFPPIGSDEWILESDGVVVRYIKKIETVYEWGPVTMPAYLDTRTDIVARSFDDFIRTIHEQEKTYSSQHAKMRMALGR